jgi:polar amino acid transport system substrate-binding protein
VRKQAAAALPTVDEFVNRIRSDGTVQRAITEAGLRGVRIP